MIRRTAGEKTTGVRWIGVGRDQTGGRDVLAEDSEHAACLRNWNGAGSVWRRFSVDGLRGRATLPATGAARREILYRAYLTGSYGSGRRARRIGAEFCRWAES